MNDLKMDLEKGMTAKIETNDEVLGELLNSGKIFFAPLFVVSDPKDERTNGSYFESPYSGVFNETRYIINQAELKGFVWTTSPKKLNVAR